MPGVLEGHWLLMRVVAWPVLQATLVTATGVEASRARASESNHQEELSGRSTDLWLGRGLAGRKMKSV